MDVVQVRKVASEIGKDMGLSGTDLINFVNEAVLDAKAEADAARKEAASAKKELQRQLERNGRQKLLDVNARLKQIEKCVNKKPQGNTS